MKEEDVILNTSDGDVKVKVLEIRGNKVRLGFDAPQSVIIKRSELLEKESSRSQGQTSPSGDTEGLS